MQLQVLQLFCVLSSKVSRARRHHRIGKVIWSLQQQQQQCMNGTRRRTTSSSQTSFIGSHFRAGRAKSENSQLTELSNSSSRGFLLISFRWLSALLLFDKVKKNSLLFSWLASRRSSDGLFFCWSSNNLNVNAVSTVPTNTEIVFFLVFSPLFRSYSSLSLRSTRCCCCLGMNGAERRWDDDIRANRIIYTLFNWTFSCVLGRYLDRYLTDSDSDFCTCNRFGFSLSLLLHLLVKYLWCFVESQNFAKYSEEVSTSLQHKSGEGKKIRK